MEREPSGGNANVTSHFMKFLMTAINRINSYSDNNRISLFFFQTKIAIGRALQFKAESSFPHH